MHHVSHRPSRPLSPAHRRKNRAQYRAFHVEPLENRQLLSTFYVATSGSDSASGDAASPFKTIQKGASVLHAGDTLNVRPGTYQGFTVGNDSSGLYGVISGTSSAPITIQADPSAAPGSVVINSQSNVQSDGITVSGGSNWLTIKGFTLKNSGAISRDLIRVVQSDNVTISGNDVSGAKRFGMFTSTGNNVTFENNTIHDNPGQGDSMTGHGIYLSDGSVNPVVRANAISTSGSQALHINGNVTGALIEMNKIFNNINNGINADGLTNSRILNNLITGSTKHGISLYRIDSSTPSTGNLIANNTIYQPSASGAAIQLATGSTNNTIFNNVLVGGTDGALSVSSDSRSGLASDYNAVADKFTNGSAQTLSQWRSSTGQDAHSFTFSASSAFANFSAGDYHPSSSSPLIDAGVNSLAGKAAPSVDADRKSRPQGSANDVGGYEFSSTAAPAPGDTTAPALSNIAAANLTTSSATVSWLSSTVGSEAWNSRDLKSRPH